VDKNPLKESRFAVTETSMSSFGISGEWSRSRAYVGLPDYVLQHGFTEKGEERTRRGIWKFFSSNPRRVPNFVLEETVLYESLAVYRPNNAKGDVSVLRASENPFSEDEFKSDVAKLTRAYIERPLFLGYPSSMTHGVGGLLTGMVGGGLAGLGIVGVIDTFVDVEHTAYAWSYLWSMLGGVVAFYGFSAVSELLNGLSNRNEYYLNESAANVIRSEETHARTVQLQRDLYTTLRGEGSNMSPQEFLGRFEQLPNKLINKSMDYRASGNNLADDPSFPALLQIVGLLPD